MVFGGAASTVFAFNGEESTKGGNYNPGLSITYGSDYYGTTLSDSIYNEFHNRYGIYLLDNTSSQFSIDYDYSTRAISVVTGAPYEELGNVLGFNVGYDAATRTVLINSK